MWWPKRVFPVIDHLVATGINAALACRVLQASRSGFYAWKNRPPSERSRVDAELTGMIVRIHRDSRTSYDARRVLKFKNTHHTHPCPPNRVQLPRENLVFSHLTDPSNYHVDGLYDAPSAFERQLNLEFARVGDGRRVGLLSQR